MQSRPVFPTMRAKKRRRLIINESRIVPPHCDFDDDDIASLTPRSLRRMNLARLNKPG